MKMVQVGSNEEVKIKADTACIECKQAELGGRGTLDCIGYKGNSRSVCQYYTGETTTQWKTNGLVKKTYKGILTVIVKDGINIQNDGKCGTTTVSTTIPIENFVDVCKPHQDELPLDTGVPNWQSN